MTQQPADFELLRRVLARETYSLLHYAGFVFPWAGAEDQPSLDRLRAIIAEDGEAARAIALLLSRRHVTPQAGRWPDWFTTIHFVALASLLPRLIAHQHWSIQQLEQDLDQLASDPAASSVVQRLLEVKRRHLGELHRLHAVHGAGTAAAAAP